MKNKKILMTLVSFLVSLTLISCGLGIKDTVQDVTSEIHRESSKEDTEGLGIKQVLEQKNGEKMDIAIKDFSGYIYVMITTEDEVKAKEEADKEALKILEKNLSMISIFAIIVKHIFR